MKPNWTHYVQTILVLLTAIAADLATQMQAGHISMPWGVTAGALLTASWILGLVSKSLFPDPQKPSPPSSVTMINANGEKETVKLPTPPAAAYVAAFGFAFLVGGCTKAQGTAVETAGINESVCILNHWNEPPIQIAKDCAGVTVENVVKVLDAHQAAMSRQLASQGQ